MNLRRVAVALLLVLPGFSVEVRNPGIPEGEKLVYAVTEGSETFTSTEIVSFRKDGSGEKLHLESRTPTLDFDLDARATDLEVLEVRSLVKDPRSDLERRIRIVKMKSKAAPDELFLPEFFGFNLRLRGIDFSRIGKIRLVPLGAGPGGFTLELENKGKEVVKAAGKDRECWKLALGVNGLLGAIVPKSYFWMEASGTRPLVKFEGSAGGPGSPKRVAVLSSISP